MGPPHRPARPGKGASPVVEHYRRHHVVVIPHVENCAIQCPEFKPECPTALTCSSALTLELAGAVHAVPFAAADDDTVFVFVTNNFTACPAGYSLEQPLPPPVEALGVHLNSTAFGFGINHQIHAVELFTNTSLKVRNDGDNGCSIALPRLDVFLALRVQFENTAAKG